MVNKQDQKEISKGLNLLVKSSVVVFFGLLFSKVFAYLYRILIARYYGPEVYGLFSLALMVLGLFIAFASLGLSEGLLRFIPIYKVKKDSRKIFFLINFSKKALLFSGIIAAILLFFSSGFIATRIFNEPQLSIFLKVFAFLIPIQLFSNIYLSIIRANERIGAFSFGFNILQNAIKFLFILIFIFFISKAVFAVTFSYSLGILSVLLFSYFYCRFKLPSLLFEKGLSKQSQKKVMGGFFSYSWPLLLFGIVGGVLFWVDTFAIGFFETASLVGIYNAAIPIAALMAFSGELFMQLFFPMITREISKKKIEVARELSKQVSKWILIINMPFLVLLLLFPGFFINLLWGAEYLLAENSLRLLAVGMFAISFAGVSNSLLSSKGKSKILLFNLIVISIINLVLNFILVPMYGINGAAISTMISLILWSAITLLQAFVFTSILPLRRKMVSVVVSLFIATGVLVYLRSMVEINMSTMLLLGSLFLLVYVLLIFLTRSFDKNDWDILKKVFRKVKRR